MANAPRRSSGLDFSDKGSFLDSHPDMPSLNGDSGPSHLARNKTERRRLQGLQRSTPDSKAPATKYEPKGLLPRFKHWMINEGGRVIFYGVWIFVHVIVGALGTVHYTLKDNLVNSRAVFGATFSEQAYNHSVSLHDD
jgi:hypothetical protein